MASTNQVPFTIVPGALPLGFRGGPQQLSNAMASTWQIFLPQSVSTFQSGSVLPTSDVGPFWYTGTNPAQWYSWNVTTGSYIPAYVNFPSAVVPSMFGGLNPAGTQMIVLWSQLTGVPPTFGGNGTGFSGTTAQMNALTPVTYQQFFNTDIKVQCIYYDGLWRTLSGCPGDVKFVNAPNLAAALANNPGWTQNTAANNRVIITAGGTYGIGATGGAATHVITQAELPASQTGLTVAYNGAAGAGGGPPFYALGSANGYPEAQTLQSTTITNPGGDTAMSLLPPYVAYWCLIKS